MKKCSKCKELKNESEFYKNSRNMSGFQSRCKKCTIEASKEHHKKWKKEDPDSYRNAWLKAKYRIGLEEYNKAYTIQNGCCAICGEHQDSFSKSLAVDHCHTTGKVRGLLCTNCNSALGKLQDNIQIILKAAEYLINPPYKDKD